MAYSACTSSLDVLFSPSTYERLRHHRQSDFRFDHSCGPRHRLLLFWETIALPRDGPKSETETADFRAQAYNSTSR